MKTIRASMTPGYNDCARRSAARQWPRMLSAAGFTVRKLFPAVAAPIGTAVHAAASMLLKLGECTADDYQDAIRAAMIGFEEEISPGAQWDATSPNIITAQEQIQRMTRSISTILDNMKPTVVEMSWRATIDTDWELSGHPDVIESDELTDWKTGAVIRTPHAQLGSYSLLAEANGSPVDKVRQVYIPRVSIKKPQPAPTIQYYSKDDCESAADATLDQIMHDCERFERDGDPFSFNANPMSMMCTEKYCCAWGTEFCTLHLPAPEPKT